jgi:hypothetical protein
MRNKWMASTKSQSHIMYRTCRSFVKNILDEGGEKLIRRMELSISGNTGVIINSEPRSLHFNSICNPTTPLYHREESVQVHKSERSFY